MTAATIGRRLSAWIRSRRQPHRSPLQRGGDQLRAAVAAVPLGTSVEGCAPLMREFDPATDPVLRQWRERQEDLDARRRLHDLNSRTGHGPRDPDLAFEQQQARTERAIRGEQ